MERRDDALSTAVRRLEPLKGDGNNFANQERKEDDEGDEDGLAHGEASLQLARKQYMAGKLRSALATCEMVYQQEARRKENLLLMGAIHFQLRNFSESIFYNQQAIRVDPSFAEAYGNLGNALRELGDTKAAIEFYLKAIKLSPRFSDAYNNLASAYMQIGRSKQAMETYQMAVLLNPALVQAHSNMGNLYKAQGKLEDARRCYLEAIRRRPDFAVAWSNIAGLFKDEGELDTAIAYYQEAIRLAPELADAHSNMGNALRDAGRLAEAESAYKKAIQLRPDFALAHSNLGNVYYDQGHLDKAITTFRHALLLESNLPDALCNLSNALVECGQEDEAIEHLRTCIKLKPDHPHAYNNLGNVLKDRGMYKEALHCYITACRLMPRFAAAHSNLASLLNEQGKTQQAIAHYQEAVSIDPRFAAAYGNLGNAYRESGRLSDAIKCYTTAIRLDGNFAAAYLSLGCAYRDAGRLDDAISCFRKALKLKPEFPDAQCQLAHALASVCDWQSRSADCEKLASVLELQLSIINDGSSARPESLLPRCSIQPFHALAFSVGELGGEPERLLQLSAAYANHAHAKLHLHALPKLIYKARLPDERLRIGYVSAHFDGPLGFLLQGVLTGHDAKHYQAFCYSRSLKCSESGLFDDETSGAGEGEATPPGVGAAAGASRTLKRIKREVERFVDISKSTPFEAAKRINADGIHVLVNLDGYTKGAPSEVFALEPAPLQIAFCNHFPGPLCASYMQYTLVDKETAKAFDARGTSSSHKLLVLPHSIMVSDHAESAKFQAPTVEEGTLGQLKRSDCGLEDGMLVLCCLSQPYKIDPNTFACWCRILERVPRAVLWMANCPQLARQNLVAEVRARGIREERVIFAEPEPRVQHLRRIALSDLVLDTLTYSCGSGALDALWAGVPMVTCAPAEGGRMSSRLGASMLGDVGLSDLITTSPQEYEDKILALAADSEGLIQCRERLAQARKSSPLFYSKRWVASLELGLKQIWTLREEGKSPEDTVV